MPQGAFCTLSTGYLEAYTSYALLPLGYVLEYRQSLSLYSSCALILIKYGSEALSTSGEKQKNIQNMMPLDHSSKMMSSKKVNYFFTQSKLVIDTTENIYIIVRIERGYYAT
jgi:hypothetical protein